MNNDIRLDLSAALPPFILISVHEHKGLNAWV